MLKRILCLLLCLSLIAGVGAVAAASGSTNAAASSLKHDAKAQRADKYERDIIDPLCVIGRTLGRSITLFGTNDAQPVDDTDADAEPVETEQSEVEAVQEDVTSAVPEEESNAPQNNDVEQTAAAPVSDSVQDTNSENHAADQDTAAPASEGADAASQDTGSEEHTEQTIVSVSTDVLNQDTEGKDYDEDALYWLSRIIQAESGNQSMESKIAVGNVIMNRVSSSLFPNSIYAVIFQPGQFSPVSNGMINRTPSAESVQAAKLCLDGVSILPNALYFNIAGLDCWASRNRPYITTIGAQAFYG